MVSMVSKDQAADSDKLVVTIQGRKATLHFADEQAYRVMIERLSDCFRKVIKIKAAVWDNGAGESHRSLTME